MQVAGTLFFGVFKFGGASLTLKQDGTLIIVQGGWESGMSLVAGKTVADAVTDGGLKIIGDSGAKLVSGLAKGLLTR